MRLCKQKERFITTNFFMTKIYLLIEPTSVSMGHGEGSWPIETFAGSLSYDRKDHPAFLNRDDAVAYKKKNFPFGGVKIKEIEVI